MINRIEVAFREGVGDAHGARTKEKIREHLGIDVEMVRTIEVYTIEGDLSEKELEAAAGGPLSDPIIQCYGINQPLASDFSFLIEVGFRPGVTDNVGKTAREAIAYLLGPDEKLRVRGVYTSRQYVIRGGMGRSEAERIASGLLANDLTQHYDIF
ncbi:MAG: phosphoribosylformylglycinamidine synthase subunit PurS, partial [Syntrophales bacterium]|nr:phosphoribosylformylglycinamidine synthase subunit PurS [Syntrophales bacterium]